MAGRNCRRTAALAAVVMLFATSASAEWQFAPFVGLTFKATTTLIDVDHAAGDRHKNAGAAVRWLSDGWFGIEGIGLWVPGFFQGEGGDLVTDSRVTSVMGNVVLTLPRRLTEYGLRPFVSGGLGVIRAKVIDEVRLFSYDSTFSALDIGAGAVGFLTQRTGVSLDFRYYRLRRGLPDEVFAVGGEPRLRYMTLSFGVVIRR